jgi:glutathione S-transferase
MADRFGQPKPHPLLATERDARAQFLAALKALNLDLEPLRDRVGRPGGH